MLLAAVPLLSVELLAENTQTEVPHVESEHEDHFHHVGVFFGAATRFVDTHSSETGAAIGLDYEHTFAPRWGVGGVVEFVTFNNNHRDLAVALPISYHAFKRIKIAAGPGLEIASGHAELMLRVSASYTIELGNWTLSPEIAGDVTRESVVVTYGLSLGRGF